MEIIVPPSQRVFQKDEWYLLYDPERIKWVKVNEAGYRIINELKNTSNATLAAERISEAFGIDKEATDAFVAHMVKAEYLSKDTYPALGTPHMRVGKSYPNVLYLHLTYQCNLRCKYCYNFKEREQCMNQSAFQQMTEEEYKKLIGEAKSIGVTQIVFTGGEPLLNEALFRIADYSKSIGMWNSLITNGTLITNENAHLISAVFDRVSVSIDSHLPEVNDTMRGTGTFKRALHGLELLLREKAHVSILGVVHEHNIDSVLETQQFFREKMRCPFLAQLYVPEDQKDQEATRKLYGDYAKVRSAINDANCSFKSMSIAPLCGMCNGEIAVGANGDVFPCQSLLDESFCGGNVQHTSLKDVLDNSKRFEEIRELSVDAFDMCRDCDFKYLCSGGCRAVHYGVTGNLKKTDPHLCKINKDLILAMMWGSACKPVEQRDTVEIGENQ